MVEKKVSNEHLVPSERIAERIYFVRGQKVMLDEDMAELYEVPTRRLNEQVTRNAGSFPVDFMFRLTAEEVSALRSQNSISKIGRGGRRHPPRTFTEQGVAMLSSVLMASSVVLTELRSKHSPRRPIRGLAGELLKGFALVRNK